MILFLTIPISIIFIVIVHYVFQRFRYKLPPGPRPWPVIGNIYDIKPVRCRCFHEWAQTYGPIISFKLASELNIVVSNGELAKQVLKEHDHDLANRHRSVAGRITRNDVGFIWADYGSYYVKVRKASSLAFFNPKILGAQRPIREDEVNAMIESIFNDCINPE
ncbi:cytochrome P450 98A2-like [Chenopodium quinoa]|uniref:cytochrome P450 98A2-like n=1 Tax=Chenopodium quinoa TaxID=63459 RepID=UPI000B77BC2C|nr:cytochrome P450 98A2-like [Chenopodium quinoa]